MPFAAHRLKGSEMSHANSAAALRAVYLTGERVYLRALTKADAEHAVAWFAGPFPVNAAAAAEYLSETHGTNQWSSVKRHFALCRVSDDEVVGGLVEDSHRGVSFDLSFHLAPWLGRDEADSLRAEALGLVVPWLRDERDALVVFSAFPADEPQTIAAAERAGMTRVATLRRHVARPGRRVDLLLYEALNPHWEDRYA